MSIIALVEINREFLGHRRRGKRMTDRFHGLESSWITALGTVFAGAIGAFGLWLANRTLGRAAFQKAINSGFQALLEEINDERTFLRDTLTQERIQSASERAQLRGEIINLTQTIESLYRILRDHGISIPQHHKPQAIESIDIPYVFKGSPNKETS